MSSATDNPRQTAAWRLSIRTTLAFALGIALAFMVIYHMVAQTIHERTDAWLSGEAEVLGDVAMNTHQDRLYNRIVAETAELATREVPAEDPEDRGSSSQAVFFLQAPGDEKPVLWVGPGTKETFLRALQAVSFTPGVPRSVSVDGFANSFRVVINRPPGGGVIYLGLSDRAARHLLEKLTLRFFLVWGGTVLLGFVISFVSLRGTLRGVEEITERVAQIDANDLATRLPEAKHSDEISRLSRTFNQMLDRVDSSVNQLRTLTDALAHDLKSPVTSIRGRLELALTSDDSTDWRDAVAEAVESLDRMAQFLNTTLDLSEAAAGALHVDRSRLDLSQLLLQMLGLYQPALAERQHQLEVFVDCDVHIDGDVSLIRRMLGNLLDNELIHLPNGCRIDIYLASRQDTAELRIEDNGPGFPPTLRERAFERFAKGEGSPGHGLGLAFVDAVVRAHGGVARIMADCKEGTVISLSLPLSLTSHQV